MIDSYSEYRDMSSFCADRYNLSENITNGLRQLAIVELARRKLSNSRTKCDVSLNYTAQDYGKSFYVECRFKFTSATYGDIYVKHTVGFEGDIYNAFEMCIAEATEYFNRITHWLERSELVRGRYGKPPMNMRRKRKLKGKKHENRRI